MDDDLEEFDNDITNEISDDEEDITDIAFEDDEKNQNEEKDFKLLTFSDVVENMERTIKKTIPILTKFEKARIMGVRLQQIANGSKPRISVQGLHNILEIVEKELVERKIPFIIRRTLPNGLYEDWRMEDFETLGT